jgi:hypothetical protein
MRGIRRWLTSAALLTGTAASAQPPMAPVPAAEPPIAAALPGGTVVGGLGAPAPGVTILPVADTPAAAAPIVVPPPLAGKPVLVPDGPLVTPIAANAPVPGCGLPGGDCCGPLGGHGPVGQEVCVRVGASFPLGNGLLARALNVGVATHVGGRAQYFDPSGTSAWVIDLHGFYTYNNANAEDIITVRGEPVTVRALHRSGVGAGIGQDYFLAGPGFVGGLWDANLRYGWDVGGRWGSGHTDLNNPFVPALYRRKQDVFLQPFFGLSATLDVPVGGWTCFVGGRLEWNYTSSHLIERDSNFQEVVAQVTFGVRY